ncbi:MAG: hypothetical protein ABL930_05900, partial [Pseudobdellovibrio sp.]
MRHFIVFVVLVFGALTAFYYNHSDQVKNIEDKKIHVYASSSFIAKWGPGPSLKEAFEKQNIFKIEFVEISDMAMAIQKINFENESSIADVVLGIDQFDVTRVANKIKWRDIERNSGIKFVETLGPAASEKTFV